MFSRISKVWSVAELRCMLCFSCISCCIDCVGVTAPTVQLKIAGVGSLFPAVSTATTANLCGPVTRLLKTAGLLQLENVLLSRLHWKPAIAFELCVAVNDILIELELVVPPFCTGVLLPSTADVIVVFVGGVTVAIVQLKLAGVGSLLPDVSTALT